MFLHGFAGRSPEVKNNFLEICVTQKRVPFFEFFPLFKGPGRAHTGPYGPIWSDFCSNFARFGSKIYFLR